MRTKTAPFGVMFSLENLLQLYFQIYSVVETFVSGFILETPHHIVVKRTFNIHTAAALFKTFHTGH